MQVALVSPEGITHTGETSMVVCRTVGGGDIAFQSGHAPFIGVLQIREARIYTDDGVDVFAVHSGFVQVAGGAVTILSDVSEMSDEIDVARAQSAKERAEATLAADAADADAAAAMERAETRLRVATGEAAPAAH